MKNVKLIVALLFAGINLQAAEIANQAPEYEYGVQGANVDLRHFQNKYVNLLVAKNLQLNLDEINALTSEAEVLWSNNNWSQWELLRDLSVFDFIVANVRTLKNIARRQLENTDL